MANPQQHGADWRPFRRVGLPVAAERLQSDLLWTSASGTTLHGRAGHWKLWETERPWRVWTVTDPDFRATYEPAEDGLFRSVGRVLARPAVANESVESKEGSTVAHAGDWVVTRDGHRWVVSPEEFSRRYRPDPDETS